MSVSLVKKSLQLIESCDFRGTKREAKQKSDTSNSKASNLERIHQRSKFNKNNSKNTNILKKYQKLQKQLKEVKNQDKTEHNLEWLKAVSESSKVENTKALELFKRATKNREVKIEEVEEVPSTVFTEEDFARFEREYVFD